jgi:diguanylate cyclase (GGDEF)-like protein
MITVLGFYFDTFLKANYFKSSKEKISHAKERLENEFQYTQKNLSEGVKFLESNTDLKASLELINNYEDKQNYNHDLLDEEKKEIVVELLERVKSSFYDSGVIYDKNGELVAFVYKHGGKYKLNYISYEDGKQLIFSKYEKEKLFHNDEFMARSYIKKRHVLYYTQPELHKNAVITYQFLNNSIDITSHNSAFDEFDDQKTIFHIEMSKIYDYKYFAKFTEDTEVSISLNKKLDVMQNIPLLFSKKSLENKDISENKDNYYSSFVLNKNPDNIFITFSLGKDALYDSLKKNREQLLIFMVFSTLIILVLYYILIYYGISKPLTKLMEQISRIKQGDYTEVPVVKTADELEEISKNINMLAVAVQTRENSLKQWQSKLEYLSTHDELTGLFNRRSFSIKLEYALKKAKRNQTQIAILFLDLDEFKQVNDTLGHTIGDNLLKAVAHRLETSLRESDVLARVGGDEFNIFVDGFKSIIELQTFAQKLLDDFTEPFVDVENEIVSSTSIGISLFPNDGEDVETLIKNADLAMYKAKENGKNSYSFYSSRFSEFLQHRMDIVQALKSAIKSEDEFVLHYQPKVSIQTQKVVGVEALIRWNSSELGFVRPDQFIKIAEETHMILDIGLWVLRKACEDFMFLKNNNCHIGSISVNVSSVQLEYGDMLQKVKDVITYTGISAEELELEVTESYIATHEKRAIETLTKFRNMGVALAIDDFGTGYSSMSYLQALPVTRLKIDKGFVDDLPDSKESTAIVNAIISLAETFGLKITVEGIEKEEQLNFFKGKYCDEIQGYFYSKPLPLKELQSFVKEKL